MLGELHAALERGTRGEGCARREINLPGSVAAVPELGKNSGLGKRWLVGAGAAQWQGKPMDSGVRSGAEPLAPLLDMG